MPYYIFEHIKTGKHVEVFFHMNDEKVYTGESGKEKGEWRRVWTKPNASIDTEIDPYSAKDFSKVTNKPGKVGDLWDRSAELSAKRADKEGVDPVKQKFYDNYAKKRHGKKHPMQAREEWQKKAAKVGIKVDYGE